jgi:hypothetical protein
VGVQIRLAYCALIMNQRSKSPGDLALATQDLTWIYGSVGNPGDNTRGVPIDYSTFGIIVANVSPSPNMFDMLYMLTSTTIGWTFRGDWRNV